MEENKELQIGQSVENMTEEERRALRMSMNPDQMGFDGREGEGE